VTGLRTQPLRDGSGAPLRWGGWVFLGASALLLPWMAFLAISLPTTASAGHWTGAWIGIDVMEATGLAITGWLVLRRDLRVRIAAGATGGFLLADAWFDVMTAQPTWDVLQAAMTAVLVELPLLVLCSAVALTAPRWCFDSDGS
jgi:hypothetical protein